MNKKIYYFLWVLLVINLLWSLLIDRKGLISSLQYSLFIFLALGIYYLIEKRYFIKRKH